MLLLLFLLLSALGVYANDQYIVVLKGKDKSACNSLIKNLKVNVKHQFEHHSQGFVASLSSDHVAKLKLDNQVAFIEKDQTIKIERPNPQKVADSNGSIFTAQGVTSVTSSIYNWGLSRICNQLKPLTFDTYVYPDTAGAGVDVYVLDTGINTKLPEFEGRASLGKNFLTGLFDSADDNGHGTHVAGIIGSKSFGVAKKANIISVKVLDMKGVGSLSNILAGLDWILGQKKAKNNPKSVVNISIGSFYSSALNNAVNSAVDSGLHCAVAAGNSGGNACSYSPSSASKAISVGASDINDIRATFSNYGSCVSLYAPGVDIYSLWYLDSNLIASGSGTSMSAPHVAGVVALYLATPLYANQSPSTLKSTILSHATRNILRGITSGRNYLLNTNRILI